MSKKLPHSISTIPAPFFYATKSAPTTGNVPTKPHSTPISFKASGYKPFSSNSMKREDSHLQLAEEISGRFLGPMPVNSFLDEFLPMKADKPTAGLEDTTFVEKIDPGVESDMYKPFISAADDFLGPKLKIIDTSNKGDPKCGDICPDAAVYNSADIKDGSKADFSKMEFWIEFKLSSNADPFRDPPATMSRSDRRTFAFENDSMDSRATLGQIGTYAAAQMAMQFRTAIFSILICGKYARFFRWERAGTIVSERFDYVKDPQTLGSFFSRYSQLDRKQRGHDLSVKKPRKEEIVAAKKALRLDADDSDLTFVKLAVPHGETEMSCIALAPRFEARSPIGRGSRAFTAYDITNSRVVFLKDYWRIIAHGMEKEGDIYADLHKFKVPNIPRFGGGDDVGHSTTTHKYRMVLLDVGRDLTSFDSSWEYVHAIGDAVEAHWVAYNKARILHRDISVGNILITADGAHGLLIDWDLCKRLPPSDEGSDSADSNQNVHRRPERTGTWQFLSAKLIGYPNHEHCLEDDLESFLWVLLWVGLRYSKHNLGPSDLSSFLEVFDEVRYNSNTEGGTRKQIYLRSDHISTFLKFSRRELLNQLVMELTNLFAERYAKALTEDDRNGLKALLNASLPQTVLETSSIYRHDRAINRLKTSLFVMEKIRDATLDRDAWPIGDKSTPQPLDPGLVSENKRKRDSVRIESIRFVQNKKYKAEPEVATVPDVSESADDDSASDEDSEPLQSMRKLVIGRGRWMTYDGEEKMDEEFLRTRMQKDLEVSASQKEVEENVEQ